MSVINQMLRDLEARGVEPGAMAPAAARAGDDSDPHQLRQRRILIGLMVALWLVAAGLWWQRGPLLDGNLLLSWPPAPATAPAMVESYGADSEPAMAAAAVEDSEVASASSVGSDQQQMAPSVGDEITAESGESDSPAVAPVKVEPLVALAVAEGFEAPASAQAGEQASITEVEVDAPPVRAPDGATGTLQIDREGPTASRPAGRSYQDARRFLRSGDWQRALQALEAAVAADPELLDAQQALVALLMQMGRVGEARERLSELVARHPDEPQLARRYARVLVDGGDWVRAAEVLAAARDNARQDLEFLTLDGTVQRRLGDHAGAIESYRQALALNREDPRLWLGLGLALTGEGAYGPARAAYQRALDAGVAGPELEDWLQNQIRSLEGRASS